MATRIYLVPVDDDRKDWVCPKYLEHWGVATGNISVDKKYYIMKAIVGRGADFDLLETFPDVIRLDKDIDSVATKAQLAEKGCASLAISVADRVGVEREVMKTFLNETDKDFKGLNKIHGE